MRRLMIVPVLLGLGLVVLLGAAASFQQFPARVSVASDEQSSRTLSVHGIGSASAPAEALTLHLVIESWDDYYGRGVPRTAAEKLQPVIDAAVAAGVDEDSIVFPTSYGPGGFDTVRLSIHMVDPTQEQIQAIFSELEQTTRAEDMYVVFVGGYYEHGDCSALETEAFDAAIEDARNRAGLLAGVMLADLVEVIDVSDQTRAAPYALPLLSSCDEPSIADPTEPYFSMLTRGAGAAFDPDAALEVRHVRIVNVIYRTE